MQQAQQREAGERISWARALIFAVGFFFLAAFLIGQLPSFVNSEMTASSLVSLEQALLALAYVCLGGFLIVQAIVMLFDPKPVVPPAIFSVLGFILTVAGGVLIFWASWTGNQTVPAANVAWNSIMGGALLWLPPGAIDLVALGAVLVFVGLAWFFYSVLAFREQSNPDRRDPGTTPGIRALVTLGTVMLVVFLIFFAFVSPDGLAHQINPSNPNAALFWVNTAYNLFLILAIVFTIGAFALRLHYLMRPVRKNTMNALYAVGVNLAPIGVLCLIVWFVVYPFLDWLHYLPALGPFFTLCARVSDVPQSCAFTQQGGELIGSILTVNGFIVLMGAAWAWRTKRNLVIIGGVTIGAILALATLLTHIEYSPTTPYQATIALLLCGGSLVLITIWTSVARREFAVVGEKPLGCLGMWLIVGTCLFIYIASFAFFSLPGFFDTETNIPFIPGAAIGAGSAALDAFITLVLIGILAGVQFYFLVRNRYRV